MTAGIQEHSLVLVTDAAVVRTTARSHSSVKRIVDVVAGSLLLVMSIPLLAVCALIIKLSSKGPVVYCQERVGRGGKRFTMFKLRTMRDNAEADSGAVWASDRDPRVIPLCRWMRYSHVDELPQLVNVIKGEMSLVGPRPERAEILTDLQRLYPNIHERLQVAPGITGLAQLRWSYDTTPERFRHKLDADLEYIRKHNMRMDFRILVATVPKVFDKQAR